MSDIYELAKNNYNKDGVYTVRHAGGSNKVYYLSYKLNIRDLEGVLKAVQGDFDGEWNGMLIIDFENRIITIYDYYVE